MTKYKAPIVNRAIYLQHSLQSTPVTDMQHSRKKVGERLTRWMCARAHTLTLTVSLSLDTKKVKAGGLNRGFYICWSLQQLSFIDSIIHIQLYRSIDSLPILRTPVLPRPEAAQLVSYWTENTSFITCGWNDFSTSFSSEIFLKIWSGSEVLFIDDICFLQYK